MTTEEMRAELARVLFEFYDDGHTVLGCRKLADQIVKNLPMEFYPNLLEWLMKERLSEIRFEGQTIQEIIDEDNGIYNFVETAKYICRMAAGEEIRDEKMRH